MYYERPTIFELCILLHVAFSPTVGEFRWGRYVSLYELQCQCTLAYLINPLAPNDVYVRPIAQLTSRRCILNVYSTNILTEYFKHAAHSSFFLSLQDAGYFTMLSFLVPVIFTS